MVYVLMFNGRGVRQMLRLLRIIYRPQHYYYIHVDKKQEYASRALKAIIPDQMTNIVVAEQRFNLPWGGTTLLSAYLKIFNDLLVKYSDWKWDYLLNYSESDFPLLPVEDLVAFVTENIGKNFLRNHHATSKKFITADTMQSVFVECENFMWRVGRRKLPEGIMLNGGSDWYVMHRPFVEYATTENADPLVSGVYDICSVKANSPETFFHSVLSNSKFCLTHKDTNLRLTAWNDGVAIDCEHRKEGDFCGKSPTLLQVKDKRSVNAGTAKKLLWYTGRKFDPLVDLNIINWIEAYNLGATKDLTNHSSWRTHWQCEWDKSIDPVPISARLDQYLGLIMFGLDQLVPKLSQGCPTCYRSIIPTAYHVVKRDDLPLGIVLTFQMTCNDSPILATWQIFIIRKIRVEHHVTPRMNLAVAIGTSLAVRKEIFLDYIGAVVQTDTPEFFYKWSNINISEIPSNVSLAWLDPQKDIKGRNQLKRQLQGPIAYKKEVGQMQPGIWTVVVSINNSRILSTQFLVLPDKSGYQKKQAETPKSELRRRSPNEVLTAKVLSQFYAAKNACIVQAPPNQCPGLNHFKPCKLMEWSSFYPDPKSMLVPQ